MPIASRSLPSLQSRTTFSWFMLISANVLWASSYVAGEFALRGTSLIIMLTLRMSISALIDGSAAASTLFIQPLFGTLLAIVLLNDQLSIMTVVGGLLIAVSVYMISRQ